MKSTGNINAEDFFNKYLEDKRNSDYEIKTNKYNSKEIFSIMEKSQVLGTRDIASIILDNNLVLISSNRLILEKAIETANSNIMKFVLILSEDLIFELIFGGFMI